MFASVLVTAPDLATVERISRHLIERRLAACANYWPIRSMYHWEGKVEQAPEYAMLLKVRATEFDEVAVEVSRLHPYDVPCIVKYDITEGWTPYLEWIKVSTGEPEKD